MKALILAAGYGTRLLPYTLKIPKPLFTLNSTPILKHVIKQLIEHGCERIFINTHHLHEQIEVFADQLPYNIHTIYEPVIMDTGGAIAHARPFLDQAPFFVINSDIISNVDLTRIYESHKKSDCLATLVLHDCEKFNKVSVDDEAFIRSFNSKADGLAFTGIQVLSPEIFNYFPDKKIFSSIEVYQELIQYKKIRAVVEKKIYWSDIGTKESYSMTSLLELSACEFGIERDKISDIKVKKLAGDGSDRLWYRVSHETQSFIIGNHGICLPDSEPLKQLNAFIQIGRHIYSKNIPVPKILNYDTVSGMVIMEDLGDVHLETIAKQQKDTLSLLKLYQKVIDSLIEFSSRGFQGFNTEWTCQTATYSKEMILEKECRYFMEAFINGYLNLDETWQEYENDFCYIADHALKNGYTGLMHRDCQSRNIMMCGEQPFFIDFQSARIGPLQYDLASLLIDPYVGLADTIKETLLHYTIEKLNLDPTQKEAFIRTYQFCCLTRNLQFLGAFSFLGQVKKKTGFEQYIPFAINLLKNNIIKLKTNKIPKLSKLIEKI
ncbi:MAG: sugar phosphate nucleotidyltransferase [Desulfobacula sp.]|jgi:aminoglycoside/choline kinase family phosphotransferase/dTDP-glucose pyrophosphorylase